VIGEVARYSIVERFCRVLSSMVLAGVPLPEAMIVVSESTRNIVYQRALDKVRLEMLEGEGIAGPITRTELFPTAEILVTGVDDPQSGPHGPDEGLHLAEFERVCLAETLFLSKLAG